MVYQLIRKRKIKKAVASENRSSNNNNRNNNNNNSGVDLARSLDHENNNNNNNNNDTDTPPSVYCIPFKRSNSFLESPITAEKNEFVTVMFADIVGFTEISSRLDASKVKDLLNRWFKTLEILADDFKIYEIETIGDAFICATNIFDKQGDHAARMAKFGICALKASELTRVDIGNHARGNLTIRIGVHSGPCVASVIGMRHPKFTLFGDTVNVASRMESTSEPGRMQCSLDSARLISAQDDRIKLVKRGVMNIKGKGFMKTYWVERTGTVFSVDIPSTVSQRIQNHHHHPCKIRRAVKVPGVVVVSSSPSPEMNWDI